MLLAVAFAVSERLSEGSHRAWVGFSPCPGFSSWHGRQNSEGQAGKKETHLVQSPPSLDTHMSYGQDSLHESAKPLNPETLDHANIDSLIRSFGKGSNGSTSCLQPSQSLFLNHEPR